MALPLLAVQLTRSPALIALVAVAVTLPWLVTALHVGVLVDRRDRRRLMLAAEVTRLVAVAVLLGAVVTGTVVLPLIYATALVLGTAEVVAMTANASIIPAAVPRTRWQTAVARFTAVEYLANGFVGTPIGGLLVAAGFVVALGATGLLYLAGGVLLALLAGTFTAPATRPRQRVNVEIRAGLAFLWQHRLLRTMALLIAVMAGCWSAWMALIPAYAADVLHLDPRQYGLLLTALGAGGVVGTVLVGPVNRVAGRRWSMSVDIAGSFLLVPAPAVVPVASAAGGTGATGAGAVAVGAAAFVAGIGGTMWTVNARVIYQTFVPDDMLGRFMATTRLIGWGTAPVAAALAGVLATAAGYRPAFAVFALVAAGLVYPYLRVVTPRALAEVQRPDPAGNPDPSGTPDPSGRAPADATTG